MRFRYTKVHFVGIGGIGMSALANILISLGVRVTGSDVAYGANIRMLESKGARVWVPHSAEKLPEDTELVVYSSAIPSDNEELLRARELSIPLMKRGELLAELTREKESYIVAGSHGKTTTTALLGKILLNCGLSPTIIVGGRIRDLESSNALMGSGDILVAESDESDGSFLMLSPYVGILTNVDKEHLNYYGDFDSLKRAFKRYLESIRGARVVCMDDENAFSLASGMDIFTYSVASPSATFYASDLKLYPEGTEFVCYTPWGKERLFVPLPGTYNVQNCLAAVGAALLKGLSFSLVASAVSSFKGVERRLTVRGYCNGAVLVDDYAHHPTEIVNTLKAVRQKWNGRRIVAVFQPHRFSRMKALWRDFLGAFDEADVLWVTDVYAAGESPNGFSIDLFLKELSRERPINYLPHWSQMVEPLRELLGPDDVLVTMGAGDIWKLCVALAESVS